MTPMPPIQFLTLALYKFIYLLTYCPLTGIKRLAFSGICESVHMFTPKYCSYIFELKQTFSSDARCHF